MCSFLSYTASVCGGRLHVDIVLQFFTHATKHVLFFLTILYSCTGQATSESTVLSAATELRFLADEYRIVISLDVSPSVSTVDPVSHSIMFEEVTDAQFVRVIHPLDYSLHASNPSLSNTDLFPLSARAW